MVLAETEDDLQLQPEVQISSETLSTVPVDPAENDQPNSKRTIVGLLGTTKETKDAAGRVTPEMTSPPPLPPSRIQKKLSGSVEVEVTRVPTVSNQKASGKTTPPLAPEKDQENEKSTTGHSKDFEEGPGTALLTPETLQEPLPANDQPRPSNPDSGDTELSRGLATPLMATEDQPEPPPEEPSADDDQPGQAESSRALADHEGFQNPERSTGLEHEAVPIRPKEATEEENREEEPNEHPSFETPRGPRVMPNKGEVGIPSALATSKQSSVKELQREFTPKLTFALQENTEMERAQKESTDNKEIKDGLRMTSMMKTIEQVTNNSEDSELPKVSGQAVTKHSGSEVIEIPTRHTVPVESRTPVLGVPVTKLPVRVKSPLDSRSRSDDLSRDPTQEELTVAKDGRRNVGAIHQIPQTTPLFDSLPHLASVETSKNTPKRITSNPSKRRMDSRNAAQPPVANEPTVATPFSVNGMLKDRENPYTGGNARISSGNLAVRTKFEIPAMRLAKSVQDYRRPAFCSLHKVRGHCTENLHRWYFNPFNGSCQSFTYSGCGGNPNNFETIDTCFVTCTGRNTDRSRPQNDFQEDETNLRIPKRFAEPDWLPASASLVEPPPRQPAGLEFFLDILRRKLPPPPPPPLFLRSLAFPLPRSGGPGDNVDDQKILLGDKYVEDSGKPEEQRRARQSIVSSEKRFHLLGKSGSEPHEQQQKHQQQPIAQRSRSSEFRARSNQPEKAMIESDIATLRNLLQQDAQESPVSLFDPTPLGRNSETSSGQKSRSIGYSYARKADDTRAHKRAEMDQILFEDRRPVVQRSRNPENRQSPAVGFQRFGHFVNNGRHMPQELKNFRWIEQAIVVSDLAPRRLNLPFWFGEEMMGKSRPPGQTPNFRDSAGPRSDGNAGNPQNALTLRRNSMIFETRQRPKKLQDLEMEKGLASRISYTANGFVPHAMKPGRMAASVEGWLPRQPPKPLQSSFSSSFPVTEKGNAEIPFHVLHLPRPLVEQMARRTGVGRVEQDSRRLSRTDVDGRRSGSREDPRAERPDVMSRERQNWQEQDKERPLQRRRNNNGFSNRLPNDRFTFLQIFVNRDQNGPANQPHFPKPSVDENKYSSQRLSLSRSQIDPTRFQISQNGGHLPPPPPPPHQMSPRQRPIENSRHTMTDERGWLPASDLDGPRPNREFM